MRIKLDENVPVRVMLVRIPEEEQPRLPDYLAVWFSTGDWQSWDGAFVVATPHKLRVSPP